MRCSFSSTPPPPPLIILVLSLLSTRYDKCISKEGVEGWKFAMKRCSSSPTTSPHSLPPPHPLIILILSLVSTRYNKCIDCVETRIMAMLKGRWRPPTPLP